MQVLPVEADPVEVEEVRIAAFLFADAEEIDHAVLFVDAQQLRDVAFAGRDRVLQLAGVEVVQIKMPPVVALRKPDHFVRCRAGIASWRDRCRLRSTSATVSSMTSRTSPVAASATRSVARLWSREVETNASCVAVGAPLTSANRTAASTRDRTATSDAGPAASADG